MSIEKVSNRVRGLDKSALELITKLEHERLVVGKDDIALCGPWQIAVSTRPRKGFTTQDGETTTVKLSRIE